MLLVLILLYQARSAIYTAQNLTLLNYTYLQFPEIHPFLRQSLQPPFKDQEYTSNRNYYLQLERKFGLQGLDLNFDEKLYVECDKQCDLKSYVPIKEKQIIGFVAGVVQPIGMNVDERNWDYYSSLNGYPLELDTVAQRNLGAFAQTTEQKNGNATPISLPFNNIWYNIFVAIKDIPQTSNFFTILNIYVTNIQDNSIVLDQSSDLYQHIYQDVSKGKKMQNKDLGLFHVKYLKESEGFDKKVEETLNAHNVEKDITFQSNVFLFSKLLRQFKYLRNIPDMDEIIYAKFINPEIGMGVFAHQKIKKNTIIGKYTGYIRIKGEHSAYSWAYYFKNTHISLDGRYGGNLLRFVNDIPPYNLDTKYVPLDNRWHILYVTNRVIEKGEELSISYGPVYWKQREQKKPQKCFLYHHGWIRD